MSRNLSSLLGKRICSYSMGLGQGWERGREKFHCPISEAFLSSFISFLSLSQSVQGSSGQNKFHPQVLCMFQTLVAFILFLDWAKNKVQLQVSWKPLLPLHLSVSACMCLIASSVVEDIPFIISYWLNFCLRTKSKLNFKLFLCTSGYLSF